MNNELIVKNTNTGEIRTFQPTLASVYLMCKFLETSNETRYQVFRYFYGIAQQLGGQWERVVNKLLSIDKFLNATWSYFATFRGEFQNTCHCMGLGFTLKANCFRLGRTWYPRDYRKYVKRCEYCGDLYFDQETTPSNILRNVNRNHIGFNECCPSCVREYYDVRQCHDCGGWFDENYLTYVEGVDDYFCDDCRDDDCHYCERCGVWFSWDDYIYVEDTGNIYCCDDCAERDGNYWDDDDECWYSEDHAGNSLIGDYHDNKGYLSPVGAFRKRQKQKLYIGRETELDGQCKSDFDKSFYENVLKKFDNNIVLERDGSVEIETITKPMTEKSFMEYDWEKGFKYLRDNGWRSHDTDTCGTHFHFSEGYLGFTENERRNNAKKVCRFVQMHWDDICKIARRKDNHYCYCWGFDISRKTPFSRLYDDRYFAVNVTNMERGIHTIEVRVCKGTLKTQTMLASADFFLHIVRNAKRISWKNIDNLKLWFKGIKNKNTIDYIKARHAFEGAF